MATAITGAQLADWLKLSSPAPADVAILDEIAASVSAFVQDFAPAAGRDVDGNWTASTSLGAKMLGARLYRRRNSPNGVEAFTDQGAAYVVRYDSDVTRLLRLNGPQVG
jgi:hypothetical protein